MRIPALLCCALAALVSSILTSHWQGSRPAHADRRSRTWDVDHDYRRAYVELDRTLERVEAMTAPSRSRHMQRVAAVARTGRERARDWVPVRGRHHRGSERELLADRDFRELLTTLQDTLGTDAKLARLRDLRDYSTVTVSQVVALMRTTSFDSERIEIARMLYPVVSDPQRWFQVYAALEFESSRESLRAALSR